MMKTNRRSVFQERSKETLAKPRGYVGRRRLGVEFYRAEVGKTDGLSGAGYQGLVVETNDIPGGRKKGRTMGGDADDGEAATSGDFVEFDDKATADAGRCSK